VLFRSTHELNKKIRPIRKLSGLTIAELPAGLWVIFVGIGMPLLCLVLTTIRFGLFMEAARQAADVAAQAQSYLSNSSTGAITLAQDKALAVAGAFPGLSINPDDVKCWIIVTPLANTGPNGNASTVVGPNTPLNTPADTAENLYQLRVDITGQIQPVVSLNIDYFGGIPGLNRPMTVKTSMTRVFENPPGLYQASNNNNGGSTGGNNNGDTGGNTGGDTSGIGSPATDGGVGVPGGGAN